MKAKGLRIVANLVLCIGVVASLAGLAVALLISNGLIGIATDYIPQMIDYIILAAIFGVAFLAFLILHIVANVKAKRERIAACWAEAEAAALLEEAEIEEAIDEVEEDAADETVEEECAEEEAVEECTEEEVVTKTKLQIVREKILEKTPITEEQLDKAEKIGKVAIPVAGACLVLAVAAKAGSNRKKAARRQKLYKWLG